MQTGADVMGVLRDPSRDPRETVRAAAFGWAPWQPGDGSKYAVRVLTVNEGPDRGDQVLLISINRTAAAFQFPRAAYREAEQRLWSAALAREQRLLPWWPAAAPLLVELGAVNPQAARQMGHQPAHASPDESSVTPSPTNPRQIEVRNPEYL